MKRLTFGHSLFMLALTALAWWRRDARIVAAGGVISLAIFVVRHASRWTPEGRFGAANGITAFRAAVVLGFVALPSLGPAAAVLVAAFLLLDGLDGSLARKQSTASAFGARFDMETDALFVLTGATRLAVDGRLGAWILVPGILRYAYVVVTSFAPADRREAPRSSLGRYAFVVLVSSFALSAWPFEPFYRPFAMFASGSVVVSFACSFVWSFAGRRTLRA